MCTHHILPNKYYLIFFNVSLIGISTSIVMSSEKGQTCLWIGLILFYELYFYYLCNGKGSQCAMSSDVLTYILYITLGNPGCEIPLSGFRLSQCIYPRFFPNQTYWHTRLQTPNFKTLLNKFDSMAESVYWLKCILSLHFSYITQLFLKARMSIWMFLFSVQLMKFSAYNRTDPNLV